MNSRLIIKNIPKNIKETELKKKFEKFGTVTDAKIIFKGNKNRRFCFIGYLDGQAAQKAQKYFHMSYLGTSKILVDFAKDVGDNSLKKTTWSKYTPGTTAYNKMHGIVDKQNFKEQEQQEQESEKTNEKSKNKGKKDIANMEKFEEFVDLMKTGKNPISFSDNVLQTMEDQSKDVMESIKDMEQLDIPKKKIKKEKVQELEQEKEEILEVKRLYVVNLPFNVLEEDIRKTFEKYGDITELKLPKGRGGIFKGYAFITYDKPEQALRVLTELNNKTIMGRRIFIKPAKEEEKKEEEIKNQEEVEQVEEISEKKRGVIAKSSYKKQKQKQLLENINDETNWNTLFLNPNTVIEVISQKFDMKKNEWFEAQSEDLAVKSALAETQIITETKEWLLKEGISLDFLERNRKECPRSLDTMFVKNLPFKIQQPQIQELFERFGKIRVVKLSPNKSIAIVQFNSEKFAQNAFNQLQEYVFKNEPLYLEWAPQNLFKSTLSKSNKIEEEANAAENQKQNVLFLKNLNFETTEKNLKKFLDEKQIKGLISHKIAMKHDEETNEKLSAGYGFLEFLNHQYLMNCLKKIQNEILDGHCLQVSISSSNQKKNQQKQTKQIKNALHNEDKQSTKIIIRNIAFEATKHDIKEIVKNFGELKVVRLPKKMNGQHRGFAFVEFLNLQEAKNAFAALQNTHLYKRKLNIEWADQ